MRLRWFKRWALCEVYFGSVGRALKEGQQHAISDFLRHGHQCSKTLFCFRRCLLLCPRGGITWWGGAPKCSSPTQNLFTRPPEASRCFKTPPTVFRRPPEKKPPPLQRKKLNVPECSCNKFHWINPSEIQRLNTKLKHLTRNCLKCADTFKQGIMLRKEI